MCVIATILVRESQKPLEIVEQDTSLIIHRRPFYHCTKSSLRRRQGTMSRIERTISSPGVIRSRPKVWATRLIASVHS